MNTIHIYIIRSLFGRALQECLLFFLIHTVYIYVCVCCVCVCVCVCVLCVCVCGNIHVHLESVAEGLLKCIFTPKEEHMCDI